MTGDGHAWVQPDVFVVRPRLDGSLATEKDPELRLLLAESLGWQPVGASDALVIDLPALFSEALGD